MSLHSEYITAIEQRLGWLKWCKTGAGARVWTRLGFAAAIPAYADVLETADTFYMAPQFAALVDHARVSVPDDLAYEPEWLLAPRGWLWLPTPFLCPSLEASPEDEGKTLLPTKVRAVGWRPLIEGSPVYQGPSSEELDQYGAAAASRADRAKYMVPAPLRATQFLFFQDFADYRAVRSTTGDVHEELPLDATRGFGCWSYFMLVPGQRLGDRIDAFEGKQVTGRYAPTADRRTHPMHEMRWLFAALHLMAQRLATTVTHETDRATRRRAERNQQVAPPFIRVVTLRRLEEARPKNPRPAEVDWQWQWEVSGHWRRHPTDAAKKVFVEAYIKGPEEKPLKPGSHKLFVARR
jgi:hypothetical protein